MMVLDSKSSVFKEKIRDFLGLPNSTHYRSNEQEYRAFYLGADIKQCKIAIVLLAVPILGFVFNDYLFFGFSNFLRICNRENNCCFSNCRFVVFPGKGKDLPYI